MFPLRLSSFVAILLLLCINTAFAKKQKVKVITKGYRGNLFYKYGNTKYLGVMKKEVETLILERQPDGYYVFDNGASVGGSAFGFYELKGKFYLPPNSVAISQLETEVDENGEPVPVITLNTTDITIRTQGLTAPYAISALQFTSAGNGYNYLMGDVTVKLICGLTYHVDNGYFDVVNMKNNKGDVLDQAWTAFYFDVTADRTVKCSSPAANGSGRVLSFNVAVAEVDPVAITGSENISMYLGYGPGWREIKKREKIIVFKHLVTILPWSKPGSDKSYYVLRPL